MRAVHYSRRSFLGVTGGAVGALLLRPNGVIGAEGKQRKMTINLVCGAIGVSANQREAIRLAVRHGFESVEANGSFLAGLSEAQMTELRAEMKQSGVAFGAAGLPVDFRKDDLTFRNGLKELPKIAAGLRRAEVTRMGTYLMPSDAALTYMANFRQHSERLREVGLILKDEGIRLGIEYVGTHTLLIARKFPFVHTMAETLDLIDAIGTGNVGLVLDSWHWWQAGDTAADILSLKNAQVVAVDLNDAPAGVPKEQQKDGRRELPAATGVIDVKPFLTALVEIGYDGPVRAEPFNQALNAMENEEACAATVAALKKAFDLIGGGVD